MTGILLVSTWRHGGHVDGQEQKHVSPLGTKRYFHGNFSRKNFIVLTADPQHENLKFFSTLWARRPTRIEITLPVDDFMERFERGTQVESCDITHMRKTEDNKENLKKKNNHLRKVQTHKVFALICPYILRPTDTRGFAPGACSRLILNNDVNTHEWAFSSSLNLTG